MRGNLVEYLVHVADTHDLCLDTIHLAVSYIYRYLSVNVLKSKQLQLWAFLRCLLLRLHLNSLSYGYTEYQVMEMEDKVLQSLNDVCCCHVSFHIYRIFTGTPNLKLELLGQYIAGLSLLDYSCVKFLPSLVASAVIFVSNLTISPERHPWHSGYKPSDLKECVLILHDLQLSKRGASLVRIRNKYRANEFECVAALTSPVQIPDPYFEDPEE